MGFFFYNAKSWSCHIHPSKDIFSIKHLCMLVFLWGIHYRKISLKKGHSATRTQKAQKLPLRHKAMYE